MKKTKFIKRQDSGYKLSSGNSGETSLNLSNEIFDFISHGSLKPGEEKDITFRLYKEDCIKAMSFIIMKLPLYKTSSNYSNKVDNYLETFDELHSRIVTFFGNNKNSEYRVSLFYRNDGRIYLKGLRVNGFSVRDYLVENFSALQFDDEGDDVMNLRILSNIQDDGGEVTEQFLSKELLRQTAAATFLRKALKITIDKDENLNRLNGLNRYTFTTKLLKINKFPLGRDKKYPPNRETDIDSNVEWTYKDKNYVLFLEWGQESMESLFFPVYNEAYKGMFQMKMDKTTGEYVLYEVKLIAQKGKDDDNQPLQQIFYGAPGTGKSWKIDDIIKNGHYNSVRTTFHPDSDYSTFVGAYKPIMEEVETKVVPVVVNNNAAITNQNASTFKENKIVYKFEKQAFTKAYLSSWKKYVENPESPQRQFLLIEEINRGNCAQIFGDLFQLLDRSDNGFSSYPIEADTDLQKEVASSFKEDKEYNLSSNISIEGVVKDYTSNYEATLSEDVQEGRILLLPPNLYIWATMNTSDQSLFPMDSAFKRRWEWEHIPICYDETTQDGKENKAYHFKIKIKDKEFSWINFLRVVNLLVKNATDSEDKQMGNFFIKHDVGVKEFISKVMYYLWSEVCKDNFGSSQNFFRKKEDGKEFSFNELFDDKNHAILLSFMERLQKEADDREGLKDKGIKIEITKNDSANNTTETGEEVQEEG